MPFVQTDSEIQSIVIAGAGGFALEVYDYLQSEAATTRWRIKGFIDDTLGGKTPPGIDLPWLGSIDAYTAATGEVVVVAIGSAEGRESVHTKLWQKGVITPAYVHPQAIVSPSAVLERGVLICPFNIINSTTRLHEGMMVNVHCSVGHEAEVGAFSLLCPYVAINGKAYVGRGCFLGTRATVYPEIRVGDYCTIDSHTGVRFDAPDYHIISSRSTYRMVLDAAKQRKNSCCHLA